MRLPFTLLFTLILQLTIAVAQPFRINLTDHKPDEFTVAVNPLMSQYVVAAANINHLYLSDDGGQTFTERIIKSSYGVYGDPVLRYDRQGRLYMLHLARNSKWSRNASDFYQSLDRIVVQISLDNGKSFSDGYSVGHTEGRMQDKPWIAFGPDERIYISWTEFDIYGSAAPDCHSRIRVFSAEPNWIDTVTTTISDLSGDCKDDDETVEGATIAFGAKGKVFCAWAGHGKIYIDHSDDQGRTWGVDQVVAEQGCGWTQEVPGIYRTNGLPFLHNDQEGNLYLVFAECCQVVSCTRTALMYSANDGVTWNMMYYPDPMLPEPGHFSFTPNLIYNQQAGLLGLVFYGNDYSSGGKFGRVNGVIIDPLTNQIYKKRISEIFPFPGKKVFFGDYIDINASGKGFRAVWNQPDSLEMSGYISYFDINSPSNLDSIAFGFEETNGQKYLILFMETSNQESATPAIRASAHRHFAQRKLKYKEKAILCDNAAGQSRCGIEWKYQLPSFFNASHIEIELNMKNTRRTFSRVPVRMIK